MLLLIMISWKDLVHCIIFLIDLLNERIGIIKATKEQNEIITRMNELIDFVLLEEESINKEKSRGAIKVAKTKTQRKKKFHHKEVL